MLISTQHKVQLMLVGMSVIPQAFVHNLKQTYSVFSFYHVMFLVQLCKPINKMEKSI